MQNLKAAKQNLRTSATLPMYRLPCREMEFDKIYSFIMDRFQSQSGGCYYLAGVPGTGKTATVRGVRRSIEDNYKKLKIKSNSLVFIEINGLKLTDPHQCYSHIYHALTKKRTSAKKAEELLHERFCSPSSKDPFVVLIVDELDSLQTSKQDILYHLFDWPSRTGSRLVVIAIANTLDLPERIMDKRVVSRAGYGRLDFQPYKYEELEKIVVARLQSNKDIFVGKSIQLIARKVASISGDARKVLDICRRAIEIGEEEWDKAGKLAIKMNHANKSVDEATSTPKIIYIRNSSDFEKKLLTAITEHFRLSGTEEGSCTDIYHYFVDLCVADGIHDVNFSEFLEVVQSLHESRLIILEPDKVDSQRRIRLIVSCEDIDFALKIDAK